MYEFLAYNVSILHCTCIDLRNVRNCRNLQLNALSVLNNICVSVSYCICCKIVKDQSYSRMMPFVGLHLVAKCQRRSVVDKITICVLETNAYKYFITIFIIAIKLDCKPQLRALARLVK